MREWRILQLSVCLVVVVLGTDVFSPNYPDRMSDSLAGFSCNITATSPFSVEILVKNIFFGRSQKCDEELRFIRDGFNTVFNICSRQMSDLQMSQRQLGVSNRTMHYLTVDYKKQTVGTGGLFWLAIYGYSNGASVDFNLMCLHQENVVQDTPINNTRPAENGSSSSKWYSITGGTVCFIFVLTAVAVFFTCTNRKRCWCHGKILVDRKNVSPSDSKPEAADIKNDKTPEETGSIHVEIGQSSPEYVNTPRMYTTKLVPEQKYENINGERNEHTHDMYYNIASNGDSGIYNSIDSM